MDPALLTGIAAILTAVGGGVAFLLNRVDKRREQSTMSIIEIYKRNAEEAQRREQDVRAELESEKKYSSRVKGFAGLWREQLIANDIVPMPADWPRREND